MRDFRRLRRYFCLIFLFINLICINVLASNQSVILYSTTLEPDSKVVKDNIAGINSALQDENLKIVVKYAEFDCNNEIAAKNFVQELANDVEAHKSSMVILGGNSILESVITFRSDFSIFSSVQMVFNNVTDVELANRAVDLGITGILEKEVIEDTIQLIGQIHPDINNIIVIKESELNKSEQDKLDLITYNNPNINIATVIPENGDISNIENDLSKLNSNNEVILSLVSYDAKTQNDLSRGDIIAYVDSITQVPIYDVYGDGKDNGNVAGSVIDRYKEGKKLADIIEGLNKGLSPQALFVDNSQIATYAFSYRKLLELEISTERLPINAIVLNSGSNIRAISVKDVKSSLSILTILSIIVSVVVSVLVLILMLKKKEKMLLKSKEIIMQKEEEKEKFLANISHELRTPVSVIMSANQLLALKLYNEKAVNNIDTPIDSINQNCFRLLRIVNNMIEMAEVDAGETSLNLKNENLVDIIETRVLSVIPYAKMKNLEVVFDTSDEQIVMAIDRVKIEKIILNLLSNAIKFSRNKGVISVNIAKSGSLVQIIVEDSGIGIEKKKVNKIFDKFVQGDGSLNRATEGSGIGLAIVKSFVEMHKGVIDVKSVPYVGSRFTITMPIELVQAESYNEYEAKNTIGTTEIELSDIYF